MKSMKIILFTFLFFIICPFCQALSEEIIEYITFGKDLTTDQREIIYQEFQPESQPVILEVTNEEEYYYLSKYIPSERIGKKAISSVYLLILPENSGIKVQTNNITWVTAGMYANAAVTAGLKDVLIKATAPVAVSGTAALTGILKAFEVFRGQPLTQKQKDVAFQELITTGDLGEEIGQKQAEILIRIVKEEVLKRNANNSGEIRSIIINKAKDYNINLTNEQIKGIENLMLRLNQLNLSIQDINSQLKNIDNSLQRLEKQEKKITGLLAQIFSILQKIFNFIANIFSKLPF